MLVDVLVELKFEFRGCSGGLGSNFTLAAKKEKATDQYKAEEEFGQLELVATHSTSIIAKNVPNSYTKIL